MKYKKLFVQMVVVVLFNLSAVLAFDVNKSIDMSLSAVNYYNSFTKETGATGVIFQPPVEVLDVYEDENNYIVIKTREKSFVKSPLDVVVYMENRDNMKGVRFNIFGYVCFVLGFETLSVVDGMTVSAGGMIGSLSSDRLYIKVYRNENRVSLKTLRELFNV